MCKFAKVCLVVLMFVKIIYSAVVPVARTYYQECSDPSCVDQPPMIVLPVIIKLFRYPTLTESDKALREGDMNETIISPESTNSRDNFSDDKTWVLLVFLMKIKHSNLSITGLTYHDDMDFEKKYRNIHECDPFYWHPLHMPEHCAEIFADAIRSGVANIATGPVRILTNKGKRRSSRHQESDDYDSNYFETEYEIMNNDYYEYADPNLYADMSPYRRMVKFVSKDAKRFPTAPVVGMSNYGPVAMYKQPVSKKSGTIIEKLARAYNKANEQYAEDTGYFYGKIEYPSLTNQKNDTNTDDIDTSTMNKDAVNIKKLRGKRRNKHKKDQQNPGLGIE